MNTKVKFTAYHTVNGLKYSHDKPIIGIFQTWGMKTKYDDGKYYQISIAIVLGDDKKIYEVPPNEIEQI